jgi:hypothetical protein
MTERHYLIPDNNPTNHGLGRHVSHDEASKQFPARALLPAAATQPRNRTWRRGRAYNQGSLPHCVAYTGKGILNTTNLSRHVPWYRRSRYNTTDFYNGAQAHDEWPGTNYDGTSGLGLCKHLTAVGLIKEYRWCFGLNDVLLTLSHLGPIGIGVNWYESMFRADMDHYVLNIAGNVAGGHEVELTGIHVDDRTVTITNSWGTGWGVNGRARLRWNDLDRLLAEHGDALIILQ